MRGPGCSRGTTSRCGASTHHATVRAGVTWTVVFLQERRVAQPPDQGGLVGSQFRENLVQVTPRLVDDLREGRPAFRNRGHPVLQMAGHVRIRDVGAIDCEGVYEGASRGCRPNRSSADVLPPD